MSNNELDLYDGGDIQPYDPGMPVLAPLSPAPDTWGDTSDTLTNREIAEYQGQRSSGSVQLFGQPMPAGTTPQQVQALLAELGAVYLNDFVGRLGYPSNLVQSAISFFMDNATKPPRQVVPKHNFDLHGHDDWLGNAFANHLQGLSGTQQQKQQFLNASLQWLAKANQKLASQTQVGTTPAQGRAPASTERLLNGLSDSDYAKVVTINNKAQAETMAYLQKKWGEYTYQQNIAIAQNYLNNLPANEQKFFDQFTSGWIHMRNTPECLIGLFEMAIGSASLPRDGAGIAREIASIENVMKTERRAYLNDPQLQARYRTLLDLKGN